MSTAQSDSPNKDADESGSTKPRLGLGFRFDTKYNEQTGLLDAFNLGLEKFRPGKRNYNAETGMYDHLYLRSDYRSKPDDEDGWEGQQSSTLNFVDQSINVADLPRGTVVHILFHFHDNYCDASNAFIDREKAERYFQEMQDEMWENVEELRKWNSDYDFCVMKHDRWHCDLLECELTGRPYDGWTRPDKGDTLWLRSVVLEE